MQEVQNNGGNLMDAQSKEWRDAADKLLEALARDNKYIVADMVQIFLESSGYGLSEYKSYSALGGVFRRAAKQGIIKRVERKTKQTLWVSTSYVEPGNRLTNMHYYPRLQKGMRILLDGFGAADGDYMITDTPIEPHEGGINLRLERQ